MFKDGAGHGRGERRGGGGRGGGPPTGSSRGGGSYTQTVSPRCGRGGLGGGGRGGPGGGGGSGDRGGRGASYNSGPRGGGGGKYIDDHPMTGRVLTTNWNGRLPPTGRGAVIEIFGSGNPAPPSALIREMEDGRKLGGELDSMFKKMSFDGRNPLPVRPGYNTEGQEIKLYANYFPVHVNPTKINKYNVAFVGAQPPQAKKGQLIRLLVEGNALNLAKNQIPYRTNFRDIICTTKDIIGVEGLKKEGDNSKHIAIKYIPEWEDPSVAGEASERVRQIYKVQITFDFTFDLADLMKRLDPREARPLPERVESIIQALNAMFNHNPYTNENAVAVVAKTGLNKYFDKRRADDDRATFTDLSDGFEALRGFIKSVRLGTGRILLNVNVATGVFVQPVSLRYFYKETLRQYPIQAKEKRLKSLRVGRIHLKKTKGSRTIYPPATILGFAKENDGQENKKNDPKPPQKGSEEKRVPPRFPKNFPWPGPPGPKQVEFCLSVKDDKWISVFHYFKQNYPQFELDPELPVVNIGSTAFPSYIPLEAAIILAGNQSKGKLDGNQRATMVNFACRKPKQNAMAITEGGREILGLDAPQNDGMLKLGITVDKNMITVSARVLNAPGVRYLNTSLPVRDGSWNLIGVNFAVPKAIQGWTYVYIGDRTLRHVQLAAQNADGFVSAFIESLKKLQMPIDLKKDVGQTICPPASIERMMESLKQKSKVDWLLVILPSADTGIYNAIKKAGDVTYGVKTVCVTAEKFMRGTPQEPNGQYFGNVALKFNLKAGGTNNTLVGSAGAAPLRFISDNKTMIIGLDVTHPSPGSSSSAPSVAAMVASVDGTLGQWPGVISVQKAGAPGSAREMVDELKAMLESRLKLWAAGHKGQLPENIILYRDGISEGQYDLCLEQELPRLKDATKSKEFQHQYGKYPPRWSIIVCSKRHHTRFFPAMEGIKNASKTSNCVAGTTVDRDVTTPQYWEFFLQAHHCIQGTAKPCRYIVIKDEIFGNKSVINSGPKATPMTAAAMLPYITNNMCHMFGRATKAVSLCPPAYYADILCARARVYLSREFIGDRDLPHDDQDVVLDKKPMRWIRDFKPEQWDALPEAKKNHYHSKARRHRDELQKQCNLHPDVANTMFYV